MFGWKIPDWLLIIFSIVVLAFWGTVLFPFLFPFALFEMFRPNRSHQPAGLGLVLLMGTLVWAIGALIYFL